MKWRRIDPHFRDPKQTCLPREAPPPIARFPATERGWSLACYIAANNDKIGAR